MPNTIYKTTMQIMAVICFILIVLNLKDIDFYLVFLQRAPTNI